jgi:hypothetical protein
MARPLRIEFPGAVYHVTSRGNERRPIVRDDEDREMFVQLLARVVLKFGLALYAWVLLDNHWLQYAQFLVSLLPMFLVCTHRVREKSVTDVPGLSRRSTRRRRRPPGVKFGVRYRGAFEEG